jgi:regulator of replication initiation timing
MTDDVTNLVLEHLRAMRADIAWLKDEVRGIRTEQTATRFELRAISTRVDQLLEDNAGIKVRLDKVERRLDLVDEAP